MQFLLSSIPSFSLTFFRYSYGSVLLSLLLLRLSLVFSSSLTSSDVSFPENAIALFLMANAFTRSLSDFPLSLETHGLMLLEVMTSWIFSSFDKIIRNNTKRSLLLLHFSIWLHWEAFWTALALPFDPLTLLQSKNGYLWWLTTFGLLPCYQFFPA